MAQVTLQYFDGCPNWRIAEERLVRLADEYGFPLHRQRIDTPEQAERVGFGGSPTILVDGRDPFAAGGPAPTGLTCRVYPTPEGPQGAPTEDQLRAALR